MLILDHPQTPFVFRACKIEDEIRRRLLAMETAPADDREIMRLEILDDLLPALYALRAAHFAEDPRIDDGLRAIENAVRDGDSLEAMKAAFFTFADSPGYNFGTWAI